jgi:hypothetical protein
LGRGVRELEGRYLARNPKCLPRRHGKEMVLLRSLLETTML